MPRTRRNPQPLDPARLEELAMAYVARFATTQAKLEAYLHRKLRERGWAGDGEPEISGIAARFVASGFVDDAAYARSKAGSLMQRGYGVRRIGQALAAAGIGEELFHEAKPGEADQRRSALTLARKRGFGPFGAGPQDRPGREKQIAAMLRAGHAIDHALQLIDAPSVEAAEAWAHEARYDD